MKYDFLIVGAGIYGATFAYLAKQHGKTCLVIDKREHSGGNIYCENVEKIMVHKYGPHIFHTSNKEVWDFVNQFVSFNNFVNSPIAFTRRGRIFSLPFNMHTFHEIWGTTTPQEAMERINEQRGNYDTITNLEEQAISLVGKDVYQLLIKQYTEKQWGKKCTELPPSIIKRIPLRFTYNNNYFNDIYQGVPIEGYNTLIEKLLDGVEVRLNTDFFDNREYYEGICDKIVFTGLIDKYYDYQFGELEYRALRFEHKLYDVSNYQGNAVINYPISEVPYTRSTEHKHFTCLTQEDIDKKTCTVVTYEYPTTYDGTNEPVYPIPTEKNEEIYEKYRQFAEQDDKVIFGGRLGKYKYMDMDKVIEDVLNYWKEYDGID